MKRISILSALLVASLALPLAAQRGVMRRSAGSVMAPDMQDRMGPNTQSTMRVQSGDGMTGTGAGQSSGSGAVRSQGDRRRVVAGKRQGQKRGHDRVQRQLGGQNENL